VNIEEKIAQFLEKVTYRVVEPKQYQNINIKAPSESQKRLQQTTFET
jgi:hypothetical protein